MTLKNILKTTALFTLTIGTSIAALANTQKMYGIQGDSMSITTTVQAPQSYQVNGKTYTTQGDESKSYSKEGTVITTINLMVVKQLMANAIIQHFSQLRIRLCL